MFTGIVETKGEVLGIDDDEGGRRLTIDAPFDVSEGQSIAVEGVCLTVETFDADSFTVFLAAETLDRTFFGEVSVGDPVNLERAMPADGRFDGHVVQGHVDGTAEITGIESVGEDWTYSIAIPEDLGQYVVEKGSIAVDGISLTVASEAGETGLEERGGDTATHEVDIAIIPETHAVTSLSAKSVGDPVHLEVDVIAKYVENMLAGESGSNREAWAERLAEQ
ncbi:riboflavin synthase [Halococcoides cellulosivorans]|uniref:Riboflavin synthase n=1 Tax=Halococcoides cellulosivorans TaxID=1679096 RepID=A0A2R4X378_9EURY|nr:riboflavin synthase [Halococcoides cellulosivorans]AWB28244.1 riboflavin synthase [Halococcoides cellulosivorans]